MEKLKWRWAGRSVMQVDKGNPPGENVDFIGREETTANSVPWSHD